MNSKKLTAFAAIIFFFLSSFSIILINVKRDKPKTANKKPNILLIMADDMGYSDIGCYGSEIKTPNLDRLAQKGIRFKEFYNGARCCPTRASLITGLYPHQTGIGHMSNDPEDSTAFNYGTPAYQGYLNKKCVTIAEVLKSSGYETLMSGKWHLGYHGKEKWPLQRGFDKYYGILAGATNYFNPSGARGLTLMDEVAEPTGQNYYTTDAFTDYAIQFIKENRQQNTKPFFMYLSYTSPHWPLNAFKTDIDKYRGKYKMGWNKLRTERFAQMKKMGIIDQNVKLSLQDGADWDKLSDEQKDEMDYRMAIYAAQIDRMDQNIGRVLSELEKSGQLDNTLIMFLSDNGACAEGGNLGMGLKENLGTKKGYALSYGQSWANASNTPFRKFKHWVNEGGISTPLIVSWPKSIAKSLNGKFANQYGFLPDIMATLIDVAGAKYPTTYQGNNIMALEGKSLVPAILGKEQTIHQEPIFWEHEGNSAVRLGNFKLVKEFKNVNTDRWELYDLAKDRSEVNNLATLIPKKVKELSQAYGKWAKMVGVLPYDEVLKFRKNKQKKE
ncbi:arylsulfatase [Pedobacter frigidisoli]|uniref:Arylsulfatase n=2 Tax=Pedobacter frigidisoli TaxID=2530455 RepID=A0A4R0PBE3_9SPHI|nr:arylsulfatase [Pedobacter frigidisoli]